MKSFDFKKSLELWGGVECTVNRVGDRYFDQLKKNGHHNRIEDLNLFAELGISSIRYPVLWERVAPGKLENVDWLWSDERLARLRELNIRPIVGLLHHGSGPQHTSLTDPNFPVKFAEFASITAERYPWIDAYTPINEPLTTARFSGLYGYWYPHGKDNHTFARALLGQCRATVLAMKSIRRINPNAKLIQTEDLGKTYSTPKLKYQAKFENVRRWLTFDLLCGRVDDKHPMRKFLRSCAGIEDSEFDWFLENVCPPDIIGFNYYLTSERFLDEDIKKYPNYPVGGNKRHRYVDVEAARVNLPYPTGSEVLLQEAWERYKLPLAITEVHLGCTREEQLRWFSGVWETATALNHKGIDLRAVTAWSLLGSYDWNSLLTAEHDHYEPGVFDVRAPRPRPTALAHLLKKISTGQKYQHPVIEGSGWWERPSRFIVQTDAIQQISSENKKHQSNIKSGKSSAKKLLITGATGTLGQAFARSCEIRGLSYRLVTRQEMDIADHQSINSALKKYQPCAVINTAGYVRVDMAESEHESCFRENTEGAVNLAEICGRKKISYLTFSSDLVFDGRKKHPYIESDVRNPLNVYGRSKAAAEKQVLEVNPNALVVRTAAFFSPWDEFNFLSIALRSLISEQSFRAANDNFISPTYLPDLVNTCLDILIDGEKGLWHLANQGAVTWADFARWSAELAGLDSTLVVNCSTAELNYAAQRPIYSVLGSERGLLLPKLDDSLNRFVHSFREKL
jgi:dTDP-4-dehydrorhamnose reductase